MRYSTPQSLEVLYEDNHFIAVDKRVGDIVQGDKTNDTPLCDVVKAYLKHKYNKQGNVFTGVIHRLDRPVSGVVLFAKTSKALSRGNDMFAQKNIKKTYLAIVQGFPPNTEDVLSHWIVRNPRQNKSYIHKEEVSNSKSCVLRYRVIEKIDRYSLIEIKLETGRHHQIRAQLSYINYPIKGDLKYGSKRSNKSGGICLNAREIIFEHPIKKEIIRIKSIPPKDDLWGHFNLL